MTDPGEFGLKENPFPILPGTKVTQWAGLPELRRSLADVISSVRPDDAGSSECVSLHGDFGGGKSHALKFFTEQINNPEGQPDDRLPGYAIYLGEVAVESNPKFTSLYEKVLEGIGERVQARVADTVKRAVEECARKIISENKDIELKNAIESAIAEKVMEEDRGVVLAFAGDITSFTALSAPKDDLAAARRLASLFRIMTTPIGGNQPAYGAVYLFLDEMESLNREAKPPALRAFYGALRSVINGVNEHFALVMSASQTAAELEVFVPDFILERHTRPFIEWQGLTQEDAREFIEEYLALHRPEGYEGTNPFYPFSEGAIEAILGHEVALVPRRILQHSRRVYERATRSGDVRPGEEISGELAERILADVI